MSDKTGYKAQAKAADLTVMFLNGAEFTALEVANMYGINRSAAWTLIDNIKPVIPGLCKKNTIWKIR